MKNTLILFSLLFCTSLFAQEEWGNVVRNELTMKEIAPVWPGCETGDVDQRSDCFTKKLTQHVIKNFKYPPEEYKKNIQGEVVVEFYITEDGLVDVVRVTGATPGLQAEAKRNILSIPKMSKPGMMGGKPRAILYTVPFNFKTGK